MAVSSTTLGSISYTGDGTTTVFAVPYVFSLAADLQVVTTVLSTGVITPLTLGTDYTVSGGGGISEPTTGSVTMLVAPASTHTITIKRNIVNTQGAEFVPNTAFPSLTNMYALDKLTLEVQDLKEELSRSIIAAVGAGIANIEMGKPVANWLIGWDTTAEIMTSINPASISAALPITSNGMVICTDYTTNPQSLTTRTLTAGAGITVTNGTGVSGNPTVAVNLTAGTGIGISGASISSSLSSGLADSLTMGGNSAAGSLVLKNSASSHSITLKAGSLTADKSFTLPIADGTSGQVIETDGSGNLSFVDQAAGTSYSAGTGLTLSGTTFSNNLTSSTLSANTVYIGTTSARQSIVFLVGASHTVSLTANATLGNNRSIILPDADGTMALLTTALPLTGGLMTGLISEAQGTDIVSATTTSIGASAGNFVRITGTNTITSLDSSTAGVRIIVEFTGALLLTYNATSLILPGAANITTAAGDTATFVSLGSSNWICVSYQRASGVPISSSSVSLTSGVNGILPGTNGGSGINNGTKTLTYLKNISFTAADDTGTYTLPTGTNTLVGTGVTTLSSLAITESQVTNLTTDLAAKLPLAGGTLTGLVKGAQSSNIASATTTDLSTATGNYVSITGTTTITGLGTVTAGTIMNVEFAGALLLTYSGTALILPTAANITTVAGDTATFISLGSGNWRCTSYTRASGAPLVTGSGVLVQRVGSSTSTAATGTTLYSINTTAPSNTAGDQYMSQAITPLSSTNKLVIDVIVQGSAAAGTAYLVCHLLQDSGTSALAVASAFMDTSTGTRSLTFRYIMSAGTTSATTFKVRAGSTGSGLTFTFNGVSGGQEWGVLTSSIMITEYTQ